MSFNEAFNRVILIEGGYANDPLDSGGETKYGITARTARAHGYTGLMRDLTEAEARRIYKAGYWNLLSLDDVTEMAEGVAHEMFDTAVNMGIWRASTFLQRSLNALNDRASAYADMRVDGAVGPVTLAALKSYLAMRRGVIGQTVLLRALNSLQGAYYIELAERREKDERFLFGWLRARVGHIV